MIGAGKLKQYSNVLDKPLTKANKSLQVSLATFAFLFSELVRYNQTQVDNIAELERRMLGTLLELEFLSFFAIGIRAMQRLQSRVIRFMSPIVSGQPVWKVLFGKVADSLEKGTEHEDEYMD